MNRCISKYCILYLSNPTCNQCTLFLFRKKYSSSWFHCN